jgi:hypothetical protein
MELISKVSCSSLSFLEKLYRGDGFFSYSLSSDLYPKSKNWGLANTVFAVKLYFILKSLDKIDSKRKKDMIRFINRFKRKNGVYSDPLLWRKTWLYNKLTAVKNLNFSNFWGKKTVIAESRQAIVALNLLGAAITEPFTLIPYTKEEVSRYLDKLNWRNIWSAASHLGHLLFFYKTNRDLGFRPEESDNLITYCLEQIDVLQQNCDGLWYKSEVSAKQKVNAAMKIISAFNIVDRKMIPYAEKIIDFMLSVKDNYYYDGCDNLNSMFVLKYVFDSAGRNYRVKDIEDFCSKSLKRYEKYFYPEEEGFSFLPDNKARKYYGMQITKKFYGADLHGTLMFTWAISLIASITGICKDRFQDIIN